MEDLGYYETHRAQCHLPLALSAYVLIGDVAKKSPAHSFLYSGYSWCCPLSGVQRCLLFSCYK